MTPQCNYQKVKQIFWYHLQKTLGRSEYRKALVIRRHWKIYESQKDYIALGSGLCRSSTRESKNGLGLELWRESRKSILLRISWNSLLTRLLYHLGEEEEIKLTYSYSKWNYSRKAFSLPPLKKITFLNEQFFILWIQSKNAFYKITASQARHGSNKHDVASATPSFLLTYGWQEQKLIWRNLIWEFSIGTQLRASFYSWSF